MKAVIILFVVTFIAFAQIDPMSPESKCPYCTAVFPNQDMLRDHIQSVHTFVCQYCGTILRSSSALESHVSSEHTYTCPHCQIVISGESEFEEHVNALHTYTCPVCAELIVGENALSNHIEEFHHFECNHCGDVFTTEQGLSSHISANHLCQYCGETLADSLLLDLHIQDIHTFTCPYCESVIEGEEDYSEHIDYNHKCQYCDGYFLDRVELSSHIESDHYFPCPLCEYRAYTQSDIDLHLNKEHSDADALPTEFLRRTGSWSVGVRLMQFNNPIDDEALPKVLFDSQGEFSNVTLSFGFTFEESPPDDAINPDTVYFPTISIRLGYTINLHRRIGVNLGIGYSSTHVFQTPQYSEGTDGYFVQYAAADIRLGGGANAELDTSSTGESHSFSTFEVYIRPSIERSDKGFFPAISVGVGTTSYARR